MKYKKSTLYKKLGVKEGHKPGEMLEKMKAKGGAAALLKKHKHYKKHEKCAMCEKAHSKHMKSHAKGVMTCDKCGSMKHGTSAHKAMKKHKGETTPANNGTSINGNLGKEPKGNKQFKKKGKNWIQGAIKHEGALHRELGVKQGNKIPAGKLRAAAKKGGKEGKRARLAETLKGLHHKKHKVGDVMANEGSTSANRMQGALQNFRGNANYAQGNANSTKAMAKKKHMKHHKKHTKGMPVFGSASGRPLPQGAQFPRPGNSMISGGFGGGSGNTGSTQMKRRSKGKKKAK
jgi:hypothetical protein